MGLQFGKCLICGGRQTAARRNLAYCSARDSAVKRLAIAAYLIACISVVSGALSRFNSLLQADHPRQVPGYPVPVLRYRPELLHQRSNSKVTTFTPDPRISGYAMTHSCKSARSFSPASARLIGSAGTAAGPTTVKSSSSATFGNTTLTFVARHDSSRPYRRSAARADAA